MFKRSVRVRSRTIAELRIFPRSRFQSRVQPVGIMRNEASFCTNVFLITPPHLEQRRHIYFPLIRSQFFFFFTLHAEHGYEVGAFGAGGYLLSPQLICDVSVAIADYWSGRRGHRAVGVKYRVE